MLKDRYVRQESEGVIHRVINNNNFVYVRLFLKIIKRLATILRNNSIRVLLSKNVILLTYYVNSISFSTKCMYIMYVTQYHKKKAVKIMKEFPKKKLR